MCALIGILFGATATVVRLHSAPEVSDEILLRFFNFPTIGTLAWIGIASYLISSANRLSESFEKQACAFLQVAQDTPYPWTNHRENFAGPRQRFVFYTFAIFIEVGLLLLPYEDTLVRAFHVIILIPCFYYGSIGMCGSVEASRAVCRLCEVAKARLDASHLDKLAGLLFVRRYTDTASAAVLSGILVLPMGVTIAADAMSNMDLSNLPSVVPLVLAAGVILSWVVFTLLATVRGRLAVFWTLNEFRDDLVLRIAEEKRCLGDAAEGSNEEKERFRTLEEEVAALKIDLITGAGAWREFLNLALGILVGLATLLRQST